MTMKLGIRIGGPSSGGREHFESMLEYATAAEGLGIDHAFSAEAWGMDAIAPLAFLAARTERLKLGTGIMQVGARTAANTAMTALSMHTVTNGRFILGLGNSGPQVMEGLHGLSFDRPLTRMRETVEIVRKACRGEKLVFDGEEIVLPRPGGQGKALRLAQPPAEIPIYLATLAPRALEVTGAIADGWMGTCFSPDAAEAHLAFLRKGAEEAGRRLSDLRLGVDAVVGFSDDPEALIQGQKPMVAFQLSAMGSPTTNFYNDAYARSGFEKACHEVRALWLGGDRKGATQAVPDEMVRATTMIGDEVFVRERIRRYRDCGINELTLHPVGATLRDRLDTLGRAVACVREETGTLPAIERSRSG